MGVHAANAQEGWRMSSRDQFSPSTVGIPETHTQVGRFGGQGLYSLSHPCIYLLCLKYYERKSIHNVIFISITWRAWDEACDDRMLQTTQKS